MHVLHALFTPSLGGLEQAFINITRAISKKHRVTALVRPDAPYRPDIEEAAQATLLEAPNGFYDVLAALRIRRQLKKLKPDMVLAHAPRSISLLTYAAWGTGIPVCGMLHSYRTKRVMRADRLVVLTEHMREFVVGHGYPAQRVSVIGNMVQLGDAPHTRAPRTPLMVGSMGRLSAEKGFDVLIQAVAQVKAKGLPVKLLLGGNGPDEAKLKVLAAQLGLQDDVIFMQWVTDKENFYHAIDVFCLPSREESFGIVLLEAMRYGVPVISSMAPGPRTILTHGKDALMVPIDDAAAMAQALLELHDKPERAQALAANAWARVQDFCEDKVTRDWHALVELTASESRAGKTPKAA